MFLQGNILKSKSRSIDYPKFVMVLFDPNPSPTQFNAIVLFCKSTSDELNEKIEHTSQDMDYLYDKDYLAFSIASTRKDAYNTVMSLIQSKLPDFEDAIKKAYSDGQINIVNIIREQLPQFPLPKTIEEIRKIQDGEEPNDDAQDYYNQNFKK